MLKTKKLYRLMAGLLAALMICASVPSTAFAEENGEQTETAIKIQFVDEAGNAVGGGDYFVPEGINNYSVLEKYVPAGYKMTVSGDFNTADAPLKITVVKEEAESKDIIINIQFVDEAGNTVGGGDYFVPEGINNYSVLEKYVPAGYKMTVSGDFNTADAPLKITVVKEPEESDAKNVIMNIRFVTADGTFVSGGDYFLPEGIQSYSVLEQYVPEGYKMVEYGDFFVKEGAKEDVTVEKISEDIIMNISFKDGDEIVGGGDYFVPAGIQNYSVLEQYVPEGYKMTVSGDFFAKEGAHLDVSVEKAAKEVIMNIRFVTADGTFVSGGDYFLPEGIQNFEILEQYVPVGYKMVEAGEFFVAAGAQEDVTVEKSDTTVIVNISFIDRYGNVIAGGDYFVPEGIQNRNVLERYVPEGYTQAETGDIQFTAGEHYDIILDEATSIVNIQFVDRDGNVIAGGDYFVPTGIHNRNVLDQYVPEGYRQAVTGDIEFIYGQHYEIIVEKDTGIVNIQFVDREGNVIAGGDYFVPLGIVNRSVLDQYVPEGYRQAVTGDIEFIAGEHYKIIIEKIPDEPGTGDENVPGTSDSSDGNQNQGNTGNGNGGSSSSNGSGSSGSGSSSKPAAPADNSVKILPQTGYGENTVPVLGITAVVLAAVCGAAGYLFIARRRVR